MNTSKLNLLQKYKKLASTLLFFVILGLVFSSCSEDKFDVDVSSIQPEQKVVRFDSLLFEAHPDTVALNAGELFERYPEFASLYFYQIIKTGGPTQREFYDIFTLFLSDYDIRMAYEKSRNLYEDFTPYRKKIYKAFQHYKYYFPEKEVPDVYLMMTGFNQSVVTAEDILGIGVDKFLGEDARYYDQLKISKYLRKRMTPEVMPYEAVKGWIVTEFPFNDSVNNLVSNMIYHGKILYLMDACFPEAPDSLKIAYTDKDMVWCRKSEEDVWLYMMEKKILFDNNRMLIKKFIEDAPFTGPFTKESPGRVGQWVGWQIVRSYMNKNEQVTIPQLMKNDDYQKILLESGYNP
ncbi:gliding motility lipoprotein GldB [Salinivirga cyanobacteriivorans]